MWAPSPAPRPFAPISTEPTGRVDCARSAPTLRTTLARILCRDTTLPRCPHDLSRCDGSFSYTVFHWRSALTQLIAPVTPTRTACVQCVLCLAVVWALSVPYMQVRLVLVSRLYNGFPRSYLVTTFGNYTNATLPVYE